MARSNFENLDVYRLAEELSDHVWNVVVNWSRLAQDTVGKQLICAADSIGANISEGAGRGTYRENCQFIHYSRGSLYEVKHWLRRAFRRNLLNQKQIDELKAMLDELAPRLNAYLRSIKRRIPTKPNKQARPLK
jgi:four helix bundle protein